MLLLDPVRSRPALESETARAARARSKIHRALEQLAFLSHEIRIAYGSSFWWWRYFTVWTTPRFWVVGPYRINRFFYILLGKSWPAIRFFLSPLLFLFRPWSGPSSIYYTADIGKGLYVSHPCLGLTLYPYLVCGRNLRLGGGNCIGAREKLKPGDVVLGDNVTLGVNAVILGPVRIGSNVTVGANAVVIKDVPDGMCVSGVPARPSWGSSSACRKHGLTDCANANSLNPAETRERR
ncbi:MAG: hypothetical protein JXB62_06985 [Pirellulales bacterium]|nr:hypothetical protein [Pirellulales bacterium]